MIKKKKSIIFIKSQDTGGKEHNQTPPAGIIFNIPESENKINEKKRWKKTKENKLLLVLLLHSIAVTLQEGIELCLRFLRLPGHPVPGVN